MCYTILCIETGDYLYSLDGNPHYLPFSKEELMNKVGSTSSRSPMKFNTKLKAFNFLRTCEEIIELFGTEIIICENLTLFDVVKYSIND